MRNLMFFVAVVGLLRRCRCGHTRCSRRSSKTEQPIKVQGSVTKWELTNPHSWIHID